MKLLIILGIIVVAWIVWFIWEMRHAPLGYEDKDGFHEGKDPRDQV